MLRESLERCEQFEYGIWEEVRKLASLKGQEVALVQGSVMAGKPGVQDKGKGKARETE